MIKLRKPLFLGAPESSPAVRKLGGVRTVFRRTNCFSTKITLHSFPYVQLLVHWFLFQRLPSKILQQHNFESQQATHEKTMLALDSDTKALQRTFLPVLFVLNFLYASKNTTCHWIRGTNANLSKRVYVPNFSAAIPCFPNVKEKPEPES